MRAMTKGFVLAAAAALVFASSASAAPRDSAEGGGQTRIGTHFGFAAHVGPDGEARGHATFKNQALAQSDRRGHVVCVRVSGNRAIFGVEDRQDDGSVVLREFFVEDNGNPVKGQPVDRLGRFLTYSGCTRDPATASVMAGVISKGNINVRDRP